MAEIKTINIDCRACSRTFHVNVDLERYIAWRNGGVLIQRAFPELTPDQRELLMTQICGECFDKIFAEKES